MDYYIINSAIKCMKISRIYYSELITTITLLTTITTKTIEPYKPYA